MVKGGHMWQKGVDMAGDMNGRRTCVAGGGHVWQAGHVW